MRFSVPDRIFNDIYEITPELLASLGIRGILSDIDNTLVTYDDPEPTEKLSEWLSGMEKAGIVIALVSNNTPERVNLFNRSLGYTAYSNAHKPLPGYPRKALKDLGISKKECVMLGDQIFTDVWTGRFLGIRTFLVPPIKDKTNLFFRCKRKLEVPFIGIYRSRERKNKEKN